MAINKVEELCSSASSYQKRQKMSINYSDLVREYDNFSAPGYTVQLDGKTLDNTQLVMSKMEVDLNGDGTASGCSFSVQSIYDWEKSAWINAIADLIKVGAKLTIAVGYVKKYEVFYGYVDDFTMTFPEAGKGEGPVIEVTGIDAMGYMMSNREPLYGGEEKATELVKKILVKAQNAGYAKDVYVPTLKDFSVPLLKEKVDDWTFLNIVARQFGATLMTLDGVLVFDNTVDNASRLLTLEMGKTLRSLRKRMSLANQVGVVEIRGRDVNQMPVKATVSRVTVGDSGKTAVETASKFKKSVLSEYNEFVRTEEECRRVAQTRLNSLAMGYVSGEGECIGMPALVPGRCVQIKESDDMVNGNCYLTQVRHTFSADGFFTTFKFKGAKL